MDDNWRRAVGYICISLVLIIWIFGAAWIMSPSEFTWKIEIDNNTKEAIQSINYSEINNGEARCYSEICYLDLEDNQIGSCTMSKTDCELWEDKYRYDALGEEDE